MKKYAVVFLGLMSTFSSFAKVEVLPELSEKVGFKMNVEGAMVFYGMGRSQEGMPKDKDVLSQVNSKVVFDTIANLKFSFINDSDESCEYGFVSVLSLTSAQSGSGFNGSHMFVKSNLGKLQLGSMQAPLDSMSVTYQSNQKYNTAWYLAGKVNTQEDVKGLSFAPEHETIFEEFRALRDVKKSERARAIAFYTPKLLDDSVQIGVSFAPDLSNTGGGSFLTSKTSMERSVLQNVVKGADGKDTSPELSLKLMAKNAVSVAACFDKKFDDDLNIKLSVAGSFATAVHAPSDLKEDFVNKVQPLLGKIRDVEVIAVGGSLGYKNVSLAASYVDSGKSFSFEKLDKDRENSKSYGVTLAYDQGPFGVSATYFSSDQRKNKLNTVAFGASYKIKPNFHVKGDITKFDCNGTQIIMPDVTDPKAKEAKKAKGTVFALGFAILL